MELHEIVIRGSEIGCRIDELRRNSETSVELFFRANLEFVGNVSEMVSDIIKETTNEKLFDLLTGTPFGIAIMAHLTHEQILTKTKKERLLQGLKDCTHNILTEIKTIPRGRQAVGTLVMLLQAALLTLTYHDLTSEQWRPLLSRWITVLVDTDEILAKYEFEGASR